MRHFFFIFLLLIGTGCSSKVQRQREIVALPAPIDKKIYAPKIVIDAGHGGKDLGAESTGTPKAQEKAMTLSTVLMLNGMLQKMGYQTILTRGDDFFVPLKLRAEFANSNQAQLFVSVHYNSAPSKEAEGVEVFYYEKDPSQERILRSKDVADKVLKRVTTTTGLKARSVKAGNLAVIRETKMPAILVEAGFISNEKELNKLRNPEFQRKIAEGIALGIKDYLK